MKLLVLVPSRGNVSLGHRKMIVSLAALLLKAGNHLSLSDDTTPGLLHTSRNRLLGNFKRATCDWGLWLDADVHLDPTAVVRAMARPESVIVWTYPVRVTFDVDYPPDTHRIDAERMRKQPFRVWTSTPRMNGFQVARSADGQLVELRHCGFGAVLMRPSVAHDMHQAAVSQIDVGGQLVTTAFDSPPPPGLRHSEDISFWTLATKRGHRIWCDPVPYVTNGQSGGCFADEIRMREAALPTLCAQAAI